jgi:hypothetical protein
VRLSGDQLFVSAPDKQAGSSKGIVFVYDITDTSASYVQAITVPNSAYLGYTFDVDGGKLAILGYDALFQEYSILTYQAGGGNWNEIDGFGIVGILAPIPAKLRLDNGKLYLGKNFLMPGQNLEGGVICFEPLGDTWTQSQEISTMVIDNYYSDFDVSGDKMIIGLSNYFLTETRNSPAQYFQYIDGNWTLQDTFYGTVSNDGTDDGFGESVALSPQVFVIGSPLANTVDPGLAYYADASLSLPAFTRPGGIFPNPTSATVSWPSAQSVNRYELFNVSGQMVGSGSGASGNADLGALPSGVYLLKLHSGNAVQVSKVVRN